MANMSEVIVKNEEEQKEVYRLTGVKVPVVENLNFKKIAEVLNENVWRKGFRYVPKKQ